MDKLLVLGFFSIFLLLVPIPSSFADPGDFNGFRGVGLNSPSGLVFGPDGNLYVSSSQTNQVLRYDGITGDYMDVFAVGGLAGPSGLVFGPDGHLYVSSGDHSIDRFDGNTGEKIDTFVGQLTDGGLDGPRGLVFDQGGNLYVASFGTDEILRYDGNGDFIDVFNKDGNLNGVHGLVFGPDGNLYVSASNSNQVLQYNVDTGRVIEVVLTAFSVNSPEGLAFDQNGNLLVSDSRGDRVIRVFDTDFFCTVAGSSSGLDNPSGLVFGPDGQLFVSSSITDQVLRYTLAICSSVFTGVFASGGALDGPRGLVFGREVDLTGHDLIVSNSLTDEILRIESRFNGEFIDVFADDGGLNSPQGLTFGPDGHLYVISFSTDNILRFNGINGNFIDVFAAGGGLDGPQGLTFGPDGNLYVSSSNTDEILQYNGNTGDFIGVFASGGALVGPRALVFGPDRNLFVVSPALELILRYNGNTGVPFPAPGRLDAVFATGDSSFDFSRDLTFGPDGNLYVTSNVSDEIIRYDGNTGDFIDVFAADERLSDPSGLVFGPQGHLYVSSFGTDNILVFERLPVVPSDMEISTNGPDSVNPGESFGYEITVTNNGPSYVPRVQLTNTLRGGIAFSGFTTDSPSSVSCSDLGDRCELGLMLSGESIAINIFVTVQFLPEGTIHTSSFEVKSFSGVNPDSNPVNNMAEESFVVTLVPRDADVSVSKDVIPEVHPGQTYAYDITVTNNGPDEARFVSLTDDLPIGVTFDRVSFTPQSAFKECHIVTSGDSITCNLLTMKNGESIDVSIVAQVDLNADEGDAIVNIVEVTASPDNNILNSQDQASTLVGDNLRNLQRFKIGLSCAPGTDELFLNFPAFTRNNVQLDAIITGAIHCPPDHDVEIFVSDLPNGIETVFFGSLFGVPFNGFCDLDNVPEPPNFNISFDIDPITGDVSCEFGINSIANFNLSPVVEDDEPPMITVPEDIIVDTTVPEGKVVDYDVFATDNDEVSSLLCEPTSGSLFPVGITTVTCTAEDPSGNISEASFTITVNLVEECPPGTTPPDCEPIDGKVIGGEIIPIESTSLILAGAQSFSWMIPVLLSVLGIGLFVVSRKSENS